MPPDVEIASLRDRLERMTNTFSMTSGMLLSARERAEAAEKERDALRALVKKAKVYAAHREECDHNYGGNSESDNPMLACDCGFAEWFEEARTRE